MSRPIRQAAALLAWLGPLSAICAPSQVPFEVSAAQMQALGVQTQSLGKASSIPGMAYPAIVTLPPSQLQILSAPLAGSVDQLLVDEQQHVSAGQPLIRLVSPEFRDLQVRLFEAAARARISRSTVDRERKLYAEGIVAERRLREAESLAAEDRARQAQAEATLRLAGADVGLIRSVAEGGPMQEALVLRAKRAGTVNRIDVRPGQRVQAADPLIQQADQSRLWLDIQVPANKQAQLAPRGVSITVEGKKVEARALGFSSQLSGGQTVNLRAEVTQGAPALRIGEAVQAQVPFTASKAWAIPSTALTRLEGQAYIFVRQGNGFAAKPVVEQAAVGNQVLVSGDLQPIQDVAISAVVALKSAWLGKGGGN